MGDPVAVRDRRRALDREGRREEGCCRARAYLCADLHPDAFPNELTPMRDCLNLVDGGFAINSPFPLSLQPQRAVDLILSFDYSLHAPFEVRCRAGGGWVFATAAWLGIEGSPIKKGLGSELWVSTL